jgi:hypothetical protein
MRALSGNSATTGPRPPLLSISVESWETASKGNGSRRPARCPAPAGVHDLLQRGTRVPVRAWAESAALAKSAVAYNSGTLNRAREAGVKFMDRVLSR